MNHINYLLFIIIQEHSFVCPYFKYYKQVLFFAIVKLNNKTLCYKLIIKLIIKHKTTFDKIRKVKYLYLNNIFKILLYFAL